MPDNPQIQIVDANGNIVVPGGATTAASPGVVRLEDGLTTNQATVAAFHNADNQALPANSFGLNTGGVTQLLNVAGNLDRQRETGLDGISAVGVSTGSAQFAMAFLTADATDNLTAGTRTFTPAAMSGTVLGVAWSIAAGSVLTLDSGANAETVVVTAATATTFTCVTSKTHNGTVTPFPVAGFVYNQERDAAGELDGATGSGTAVAAEYEYNGGGSGNSNYDRARNLQGKGLSAAVAWTGTLTAPVTTFTASSTPTGLGPGQPIFFYNTSTGAVTEVAYTALNYTAGSTSIVLKSAIATNHNSASESFRYDIYAANGPGLNGILPTGIGAEEELLWDPVSQLYYIERSATQDAVPTQNVVIENPGLYNGATIDRQRGAQGAAFVTVGGSTTAVTAANLVTNTVVKASPGRLCRIHITAAPSATTGNTTIFDNASAASGTALAVIPNSTAVGTFIDAQMPAALGITVGGNANAPGMTISFL